jgi:outer membrane lipopolysaccharide assembly protein LptE/RlpB
MTHALRTTIGALLLALLTGCGNSLSGTYGEPNGGTSMEFHSNGKVEIQIMGTIQEAKYTVEEGKVKISSDKQGTLVMKIDDKGCLDGGFMLGKLCKQS